MKTAPANITNLAAKAATTGMQAHKPVLLSVTTTARTAIHQPTPANATTRPSPNAAPSVIKKNLVAGNICLLKQNTDVHAAAKLADQDTFL